MIRRKEPLKVKSFLNVKNKDERVTPILIKDTDGFIKPEYLEIWEKSKKNMIIRCAKYYASRNGFEIEILEDIQN